MTLPDISNCRLVSQKIATTEFSSAREVVGWMGAMQAQDFAMAKWAVGLRLLNPTNSTIETALNKGEIIWTHLMRPTWHFVAAEDVYWLLNLTANKIKQAMKPRTGNWNSRKTFSQRVTRSSKACFRKVFILAGKNLQKHLIMPGSPPIITVYRICWFAQNWKESSAADP